MIVIFQQRTNIVNSCKAQKLWYNTSQDKILTNNINVVSKNDIKDCKIKK